MAAVSFMRLRHWRSCQGQPAKCLTKSPGRHSCADQSLEAGGTKAFRCASHTSAELSMELKATYY